MSDKYQNKFRTQSFRLKFWDYGWNARYFITICTQDKHHFFGKIENQKMQLSDAGKSAEQFWFEIPTRFPYARLDAFVVMPNHIHGIIVIDQSMNNQAKKYFMDKSINVECVEARLIAPLRDNKPWDQSKNQHGGFAGEKNPMLNNNVSRIIRWYKGRCSFEIKKNDHNFKWQERFHDHIIRDNVAFERIQKYIENNPIKWADDRFR